MPFLYYVVNLITSLKYLSTACHFYISLRNCLFILLCHYAQVEAKVSKVYPKDAEAPPCGVDDMTKLAYLHEPGVLQNLRSRYDINEIYVSSHALLI